MVEFIPSEKQLTEEEAALNEVRGTYEEKYGFHDAETAYNFKSQKGLNAEIVRQISADEERAAWMTGRAPEGLRDFPEQADADMGR